MSYIGRGIDQIDNISTLDNLTFNGSDSTFNLTQNSVAFVPVSADALQIQIDGIIQSGNYTCSGSQITFDFTPSGSSVCNGIRHFGVGVLTTPSDGSVNMAQLGASGTKDATTFLRGDNTFATVSGTTINNNADNRVITGSGTANTLEGEAKLTFDGSTLINAQDAGAASEIKASAATVYTKVIADDASGFSAIDYSHDLRFKDAGTEKMRIDTNGQLLINTANTISTDSVLQVKGNANVGVSTFQVNGNGQVALNFRNTAGDSKGSIVINAGNTSYNTTSDYRLKENVDYTFDATTRLKQLKPARFNWIDDKTNTLVDGFIAHEVSSVIPEAVSGDKDATETYKDKDDNDQTRIKPQGIDQSKLVPLLTKALQEAITKIETLESRVQALENE